MFNSIRADTITRLRNGYGAKLNFVQTLYSKEMMNLLRVLKEEGYIEDFQLLEVDKKKAIGVKLFYDQRKRPALKEIKILSKSGQRLYVKKDKVPTFYNGFGCIILSTDKGMMTDKEAKKNSLGGELIARVF